MIFACSIAHTVRTLVYMTRTCFIITTVCGIAHERLRHTYMASGRRKAPLAVWARDSMPLGHRGNPRHRQVRRCARTGVHVAYIVLPRGRRQAPQGPAARRQPGSGRLGRGGSTLLAGRTGVLRYPPSLKGFAFRETLGVAVTSGRADLFTPPRNASRRSGANPNLVSASATVRCVGNHFTRTCG